MNFKTYGVVVDGIFTDVVVGNCKDKIFVCITQTKKFGSVFRVDREVFQAAENQENVFNIRTLFGKDDNEHQLLVRILAENIQTAKPIIFVVNLKNHSRTTIKILSQIMKEKVGRVRMTIFGQLVIGPPGCGKSTYCAETEKLLSELGRKIAIINFDPANDNLPYNAVIDINEYVTVSDAMQYMNLGPNGGMLFCMEFIEKHVDDIVEKINQKSDYYFLIDCPGQVELYTHHNSLRNVLNSLEKIDLRLCCVNLIDAHYCSDGGKYISSTLLCLSTMLHMALPHVNVLSKIDMIKKFGDRLAFNVNYYTDVLDLSYLVKSFDASFSPKYKKLNEHLASLVEDYSLVRFLPLNMHDRKLLLSVQNVIDKANGYLFKSGEERNVQKLLSSVMSNTEYDCEFSEDIDGE